MLFDRIASRLSDVLSKLSGLPGLSGLTLPSAFSPNGGIPIVYKGIVVTVMAIVASGTLITFGTAGAEEVPQARPGAQIPAASEANPVVEGQPLPPGLDPSLFASSPLLSTIDLTDAASVADFDLDESDDSDDDSSGNNKNKAKKAVRKALKQAKPAPKSNNRSATAPNNSTGGGSTPNSPKDEQTDADKPADNPGGGETTAPPPAEPVEGPKHKAWRSCKEKQAKNPLHVCLGSEPSFTS